MRSCGSNAARIRFTALSIFGSKNGSLNELRRGRRNVSTSSALANPLRISSRAMQADPQISVHEIGPPFNSSGGAMIHRLCRAKVAGGFAPITLFAGDLLTTHGRLNAIVRKAHRARQTAIFAAKSTDD